MLQRLEVQTLEIRAGDDTVRAAQLQSIDVFDSMLATMEDGGRQPFTPPVRVLSRVTAVSGNAPDTDESALRTLRVFQEGLPVPTEDLRERIRAVRRIWLEIKQPIRTIAEKPKDDPESLAAYEVVHARFPRIIETSRQLMVVVGAHITRARQGMLLILASIAGASIVLFLLGIFLTRRYVAATVNEMSAQIDRAVERHRELFENASDLIYTIDLTGKFLSVNRAGERLSGYTREELLNMTTDQLVSGGGQKEFTRQMLDRKMSGEMQMTVYPIQITTKDGRLVSLEVSTRLIYENGEPVAIQGMARDITERRRLEEQLWIAQKMEAVGRLAGGIAHEFGNVLTIITGYCALMLSSLKKDDPLRDEVDGIQKAAQRATSLIRHLLGFSKGQVFRPRVLDLRNALSQVTDMLRRLVGEDIELTSICEPNLGSVRFDPIQLEQVMVNLALNARDAMPGGGRLTILAENTEITKAEGDASDSLLPGQYVTLSISDTGLGMKPEVVARIFEPFFSTKERGTGLGLSTVYGIVRQSGGKILVESQADRGTTFFIVLPRVNAVPEAPPAEAASRPAVTAAETILLVEDEDDVRWLVREMLRAEGYRVVEAIDQEEAISICTEPEPDIHLMLTDVVMPRMSGPELVIQVKPLRPGMKILYMSGHAQDKFERYTEKGEMFDFIQKPLTPEALAAKVREVLDAPNGRVKGNASSG